MLKSLLALIVLAGALALPAEAASRRTSAPQTKAQRQSHFMQSQHESHRASHHHPHKTHRRPWH
ncbi:hypothetical protein QM467_11595 [Rhodoblastus sp. 17X3]|uniref:hypothetical protein n=1 Tax=Rhodoblastus sp. 17X3 TaxID=3047026 RepID=UPI0024B66B99|nr:hypothetical protein [Rhodoblastus sp. 17X3]MDI9848699.1 hypothetical protein [Rhodoblastus sp. 17X3]